MKINYSKIIENDFEKDIYIKKHEDIINYLTTFGSTDFWIIINEVGGSERRMMRLINQMILNHELIFKDNKFNIPNNTSKYENVDFDYIEKEIKKIWKKKPVPTLYFDQRPVTYRTTIERVKYLLKRNDVYNKNIVFLGDDDLTSIALSLTNVKCDIVVLEVDRRIVNFINNIAKKYNLNLIAKEYNALSHTPVDMLHKFDVFLTDPTPERIPFTLFMNNALNLLKSDGIIYTSIYSSAMSETMDLQEVISKMRLYITDIIPNFTKYQAIYELYKPQDIEFMKKYNIKLDDNSICFTETLFRMKLTDKSKKIKMSYKGKNIFGKATKRVVNNKNNDVAKDSSPYLEKVREEVTKSANKRYVSR